jgi:predicted homoserine dehydrogenase-like protein
MIYRQLFGRIAPDRIVRAGVIGTGQYATAVVTQSRYMPRLEVSVAADLDLEAARWAFQRAGYDDDEIVACESRLGTLKALEAGRRVIVADAQLLMDLPLDVIVEATGSPEAGARHAREAIRHGKHVAMVSKEPDAAVGPILKHLADQADLVYSAVDGDQHGLLIAMVLWARELGLEVLTAGKARDGELIYDAAAHTASGEGQTVALDAAAEAALQPIRPGETGEAVGRRKALLGHLAPIGGFDVTEMTIAANATGLMPDVESLHCPIVRISEIPEVLCPADEGGILERRGVIEAMTCLRHPYEAGMGGGEFIVVSCANDYSRYILTSKGLIPNSRDSAALIYRPHHLCGVETGITVLCAGLLGVPTGAIEYRPCVDVVARAVRDLKAGERVGNDHSPDLHAVMRPAQPLGAGHAVPLHLATGHRLKVDVPAGALLALEMIEEPEDSALWELRREQDRRFLS